MTRTSVIAALLVGLLWPAAARANLAPPDEGSWDWCLSAPAGALCRTEEGPGHCERKEAGNGAVLVRCVPDGRLRALVAGGVGLAVASLAAGAIFWRRRRRAGAAATR